MGFDINPENKGDFVKYGGLEYGTFKHLKVRMIKPSQISESDKAKLASLIEL